MSLKFAGVTFSERWGDDFSPLFERQSNVSQVHYPGTDYDEVQFGGVSRGRCTLPVWLSSFDDLDTLRTAMALGTTDTLEGMEDGDHAGVQLVGITEGRAIRVAGELKIKAELEFLESEASEYGSIVVGGGLTPGNSVTAETTWGLSPNAGASTSYSRADHTHGTPAEPEGGSGTPATTVTTQSFGDAPVVGTSTSYAREDHKHGMPAEPAAPDAADVTYTPATSTDWDGDADPGDVDQALDQLAERVDDLEAGGVGAPTTADYWVETASGDLSAEVVVGTTGIKSTTYADRGAAAKAGRLNLLSDSFYILRDDGTALVPWGPVLPLTLPDDSAFAWVNQGSASTFSQLGGVLLEGVANEASGAHLRVKAAPTPAYAVSALLVPRIWPVDYNMAGLAFRESSSGKLVTFALVRSVGTWRLRVTTWSSATAPVTNALDQAIEPPGPLWLRIADGGVNRNYDWSVDGRYWQTIYAEARTTYCTADQVGYFVSTSAASCPKPSATLLSWQQAPSLTAGGPQIVFDGDSLTAGYLYGSDTIASANPAWRAVERLGVAVGRYRNYGVDGQTIVQMASDAAAQIDALYDAGYSDNILVCWGGTNDVNNGADSAATIYGNVLSYCQARQAAGWKVIVLTLLPWTDDTKETKRSAVNTSIRANWATFADALADVGADSRIGDDGDQLDTTYFQSDAVHLTRAGDEVVAELVETAIAGLL